MNWVGGKLHRHSKANTNTQAKTQKQHFAKARLQAQASTAARSPLALSIFDGLFDYSRSKSRADAEGNQRRNSPLITRAAINRQPSLSNRDHPDYKRKYKEPFSNQDPSFDALPRSVTLPQEQPVAKHRRRTGNVSSNTIDDVKRNLLGRSDWMALDATRPIKMHFARPEETEKIGRRRKVTSEDCRREKRALKKEKIRYNLNRPFQGPRGLLQHSPHDREDFSIRIGSNIHQTQTQTSHPASTVRQWAAGVQDTLSSKSMLLEEKEDDLIDDSIDFALLLHRSQPPELKMNTRFNTSNRDGNYQDKNPVLPLNTVLDLDSFDKVKERSSSIHRRMPSKSSRSLHSQAQQAHSSGESRAEGVGRNPPRKYHTSRVSSTSFQQRRSSIPSSQAAATELRHTTKLASSLGSSQESLPRGRKGPHSNTIQNLDASRITFVTPERQVNHYNSGQVNVYTDFVVRNSPLTGPKHIQAHRKMFTIERQALLEANTVESDSSPIKRGPKSTTDFINGDQLNGARALSFGRNSERPHSRSKAFNGLKVRVVSKGSRLESKQAVLGGTSSVASTRQDYEMAARVPAEDRGDSRSFISHEGFKPKPPVTSLHLNPRLRHTLSGSLGDENEAWMKFVFTGDFDKMQQGFEFGPGRKIPQESRLLIRNDSGVQSSAEESSLLQSLSWTTNANRLRSPAPTIRTSANTILNGARRVDSPQTMANSLPSDTDFLSQMSPMRGCFDEGLGNISLYNNAARTVRSFVSGKEAAPRQFRGTFDLLEAPTSSPLALIRTKRRAELHLDHSPNDFVYAKRIRLSQPEALSSHRQPLQPIRQASHRGPLQMSDAVLSPTQSLESRSQLNSGWLKSNASRKVRPGVVTQTLSQHGNKFPASHSPFQRTLASAEPLQAENVTHCSTSSAFSPEMVNVVPQSEFSNQSERFVFAGQQGKAYEVLSDAPNEYVRHSSDLTSSNGDPADLHSNSPHFVMNNDTRPLLNIHTTQVAPTLRRHTSQRLPLPSMGEIPPRGGLFATPRPRNTQTFQQPIDEFKMKG